jgi:hypothetical protein
MIELHASAQNIVRKYGAYLVYLRGRIVGAAVRTCCVLSFLSFKEVKPLLMFNIQKH